MSIFTTVQFNNIKALCLREREKGRMLPALFIFFQKINLAENVNQLEFKLGTSDTNHSM